MNKKYITIPLVALMGMGMNGQASQVLADNSVEIVHNIDTKETSSSVKKIITKQAIKKLNKTMYATTVVNVRDKANSKGKKLGTLRFAQKVKVTGQDKNTGWYQIKYKGKVGYVSGSYLSTKKPSTSTGSGSSTWKPSSGSTSRPSSGSTSKPSSGGSSSSKPSTSKPSTSKPSSGSTSKPNNDDRYDTDCLHWDADSKADCDELKSEDDVWW